MSSKPSVWQQVADLVAVCSDYVKASAKVAPPIQPAVYFAHVARLLQESIDRAQAPQLHDTAACLAALQGCIEFVSSIPPAALAAAPLPLPRCPPLVEARTLSSPLDDACNAVPPLSANLARLLVSEALPPSASDATAPPLNHALRSDDAAKAAAGIAGGSSGGQAQTGSDRYGVPLSQRSDDKTLTWLEGVEPALLTASALLKSLGTASDAVTKPTCELMDQQLSEDGFSLTVKLIVSAALYDSFAPWSTPGSSQAARRLLIAMSNCLHSQQLELNDARGYGDAVSGLMARFAAELLRWCRTHTAEGRWKQPEWMHIRYAATWILCRLDVGCLTPHTLGHALPVAFRFCDDWEATSVWLGLSALQHLIDVALQQRQRRASESSKESNTSDCAFMLIQQSALIEQSIDRASGCRHPAVAALVHVAQLQFTWLTCGPAPAMAFSTAANAMGKAASIAPPAASRLHSRSDYVGLLQRLAGDADVSLFDGPYDKLLQEALRSLALATAPDLQYAHLAYGLAPLVLSVTAAASVDSSASCLARHLSTLVSTLHPLVGDTGDARVAASALHCLRCCVIASPAAFVLDAEASIVTRLLERSNDATLAAAPVTNVLPSVTGSAPDSAALPSSHIATADLLDACIASAVQAYSQSGAGLYSTPAPEGSADSGGGTGGSASWTARSAAAGAIVRSHAVALASQLLVHAPAYGAAALRRLHAETREILGPPGAHVTDADRSTALELLAAAQLGRHALIICMLAG